MMQGLCALMVRRGRGKGGEVRRPRRGQGGEAMARVKAGKGERR